VSFESLQSFAGFITTADRSVVERQCMAVTHRRRWHVLRWWLYLRYNYHTSIL
jgi:hypothetical protein